jgi:hypothetical protein
MERAKIMRRGRGLILLLAVAWPWPAPAFAAQPAASVQPKTTTEDTSQTYKAFLQALPHEKENVRLATRRWHQLAGDACPEVAREAMLDAFRKWHSAFLKAEWARIEAQAKKEVEADKSIQKDLLADYRRAMKLAKQPEEADAGLAVDVSEGSPYVLPASSFYLKTFGVRLDEAEREYLKLEAVELAEKSEDDAGMMISQNEWSDRMAAWERYAAKYSASRHATEATKIARWYLRCFLAGMVNTSIWTDEDDITKETLSPSFRKAYERYMARYPKLESVKKVREFYEFLKARGFKRGPEVDKKLKAMGISLDD